MAPATMQTRKQISARLSLKADMAALERERLRQALPLTMERLKQRQADLIDSDDIDAYVALNWLEWQGGGLRLTITGRNIRAQVAQPPVFTERHCPPSKKRRHVGAFFMGPCWRPGSSMSIHRDRTICAMTPVAMAASANSPPTPIHW